MLCIGIVVRSGDVQEAGRGIGVASIAATTRFPLLGRGEYLTNVFRRFSLLIRPSSNASYKLGQRRWKNGDCDNSGKDCACVSVSRASTVLKRAPFAR